MRWYAGRCWGDSKAKHARDGAFLHETFPQEILCSDGETLRGTCFIGRIGEKNEWDGWRGPMQDTDKGRRIGLEQREVDQRHCGAVSGQGVYQIRARADENEFARSSRFGTKRAEDYACFRETIFGKKTSETACSHDRKPIGSEKRCMSQGEAGSLRKRGYTWNQLTLLEGNIIPDLWIGPVNRFSETRAGKAPKGQVFPMGTASPLVTMPTPLPAASCRRSR
jgi:hypothetical protein